MKTLYFDCSMGAAGDMLTGALLDLIDNKEEVINELNTLGIPGVHFLCEDNIKCGIKGSHVRVMVHGLEEAAGEGVLHEHVEDNGYEHKHEHRYEYEHGHEHEHGHKHEIGHNHGDNHKHSHGLGVKEIVELVDSFAVNDCIKKDIKAVYSIIAEAESQVHGKSVDHIHFHEVGSLDAIADVSAVCLLMNKIGADKVLCSPIHVGAGRVKCAHGILPVPAPATALILKDVPIYSGSIMSELCTPTGAALLKYFVKDFGAMPVMTTDRIGYGMGTKDFEQANCVRVLLGDSLGDKSDMNKDCDIKSMDDESMNEELLSEISCNIDDMTAEEISFAMERLYEAGAKEAYTVAANMKKGRPGWVLYVICDDANKKEIIKCIFKHTSTIGVREYLIRRYVLDREIVQHETPYGIVREKISEGYGVKKSKLEYDDLAGIALDRGLSIGQARNLVINSLSD